jgi:signal transduction histidine kinase
VRAAIDKAPERPPSAGPGVELRTAPRKDGGAIIVVHDQGAGIDPAILPRVFEPYFTTRRAGTGLGLAIARNIIEGLGGTITIRSEPSAGTELCIELPPHAPTAPGHPGAARA